MTEKATKTSALGRTMRAAHNSNRDFQGTEIIKPGELIDVAFLKGQSPSLAARRTLALLIGVAAGDAWKDMRHRVTKAELRQGHKGNERIPEILDEIAGIRLKLETISSRGRHAITRSGLFAEIVEESEDGDDTWVEFQFSVAAQRLFGASDHYGAMNRAALFAFKSKYAVTLYELGCLMTNRREPVWRGSVFDLRAKLGVEEGSMANWFDFRRRVLDQAKEEIDQLAHFTLTWKERRQGRRVIGVELFFWKKEPQEIDEAAKECERPKVGRKVRRENRVEQVIPDLPGLDAPAVPDDEIPW